MTAATPGLVEFLRARLDDDERAAKTMAEHYPPPWDVHDRGYMAKVDADAPDFRTVTRIEQWADQPKGDDAPWLGDIIAHVARWDPARVLADVAAKRAILAAHEHGEPRGYVLGSGFGCLICSRDSMGDPQPDGWCATVTALAAPFKDHPDYPGEAS